MLRRLKSTFVLEAPVVISRRGAGATRGGCASFVCFGRAAPLPEVRDADHSHGQDFELVGPQVSNPVWQRLRS